MYLLQNQQETMRINGCDKPLYHTGEERTAKSLTIVFIIDDLYPSIYVGVINFVLIF